MDPAGSRPQREAQAPGNGVDGLGARLLWFVLLWAGGVAAVSTLALLLRWWLL